MKARVVVLALSALCLMAWAANGTVAAPHKGAVSAPAKPNTIASPEAITIPQLLSYQGKLTDTLGTPAPNGSYPIMFLLYTTPSGGSSFWSESQTVATKSGLFSVLLGSVTPIESVPSAGTVYLAMTVSSGPELTPRIRIGSAAFAYLSGRAASADLLQGKDTTGFVRTNQANSVTSGMIVDGTIAAADLGQMGASTGQVMKWTGSAWAPRNDSVGGGGGGTVTSVSQTTGAVCNPNPITTTGTVGLDTTFSDGRYIKNQFASNQTASWRVTGFGRCSTSTTSTAALTGVNGASSAGGFGVEGWGNAATGVYGWSNSNYGVQGESPNSYGVRGQSTSSSGVAGYSSTGYGIVGVSTSGSGVAGVSNTSGYGAYDSSGGSYGVYGATAATGLAGVYGTGTNSNGVIGASTNSNGVLGTSTSSHGVFGKASASGMAGVFGMSNASSGGYGVWGKDSAGYGVFGQSKNSNGVVGYGDTASTAGFGVFARARSHAIYGKSDYNKGVYGYAFDDDGVYGYANGTTLYNYAGLDGAAGSDSTYGVKGSATVHPAIYGVNSSTKYATVEGHNTSTSIGGAAVAGFGDTTNTAAYGLYGLSHYFGVYGRSNYYSGVRGEANDDDAVSGYYSGTVTSYAGVWGGRGSYGYGVYYSGGLSGSGSKNCVVRTSRGPTALYCQESPENWFEDFGSGTLANGHAHIDLDALFLETVTVDQTHGIKVFLQQTSGDPVNLVVQKGTTGFDVNGPTGSNVSFDYRVVAKRKGFEDVRLPVTSIGYNDPYLYPNPNDPQIPGPIRAKRLEAARLAAMNNGAGPQPHPSNPTTIQKIDPTGLTPQVGSPGK